MATTEATPDSGIAPQQDTPSRQARSIPIKTQRRSDSLNARDRKVVQELLSEHIEAYANWEENGRPTVDVKAKTYSETRLLKVRIKGNVLLSCRVADRVDAAEYMDMVSYSTGNVKFEFEYQI